MHRLAELTQHIEDDRRSLLELARDEAAGDPALAWEDAAEGNTLV